MFSFNIINQYMQVPPAIDDKGDEEKSNITDLGVEKIDEQIKHMQKWFE